MRLFPVLIASLVALIVLVTPASGLSIYAPGSIGIDVSFPQCGSTLPTDTHAFGIVGVTGGFAFTHNPCVRAEYTWATATGQPASVYINTKYPAGTTIGERDNGPAGTCASTDTRCQAYNYGYKTAQDALGYAKTQGVLQVATWWLDVETESTWSEDKAMNAVVIQAAIDYLQSQQVTIGIYSTAHQWSLIAGDFKPGLPNWVGGASDLAGAKKLCATGAFGGGTAELVQYPSSGHGTDYVCTAADLAAPPPPASETATQTALLSGGTIPLAGGFGLAVFKGGTADQLVKASGCPAETAVYYFTVEGAFVLYIPGTSISTVNEEFLDAFPQGAIPANTAFLGKCV